MPRFHWPDGATHYCRCMDRPTPHCATADGQGRCMVCDRVTHGGNLVLPYASDPETGEVYLPEGRLPSAEIAQRAVRKAWYDRRAAAFEHEAGSPKGLTRLDHAIMSGRVNLDTIDRILREGWGGGTA